MKPNTWLFGAVTACVILSGCAAKMGAPMGGGKVSPAAALTGGFVEPPVYGTGTGSTGTIKVAFDPLYPQKPTNWFLDGNPTAVGAVPGSKSLLALGGHHVQFQCTDGSTKFPASPGQLVSLSNNNEPATVKIHY